MSEYVILNNEDGTNLTGGFSRTYSGTGSSSNPSLSYTSNYYQWHASFNNDYNAPGCLDTPNIFLNNTKLLSKYRQIQITYYAYQYSERSYGEQGMACYFYDSNNNNLGTIFNAFVKSSGGTTRSATVTVDIPNAATKIKVSIGANNDRSSSYTTCNISKIILVGRKGIKVGNKDAAIYVGNKEAKLCVGNKEL